VLIEGLVCRGDAAAAIRDARHVVSATFESSFVEHAYLEPEAGWARRSGATIEIHSCTQAPNPHRSDLARILGVAPEQVRVVATAVGGGFGGKLDLTVQPLLAIAAWHLDRPVAMTFTREESMATSTKRHPGHMLSTMAADADGRLCAVAFEGDYNTGAFASWGTAVANRVPVHAGGPYVTPHYVARTHAIPATRCRRDRSSTGASASCLASMRCGRPGVKHGPGRRRRTRRARAMYATASGSLPSSMVAGIRHCPTLRPSASVSVPTARSSCTRGRWIRGRGPTP